MSPEASHLDQLIVEPTSAKAVDNKIVAPGPVSRIARHYVSDSSKGAPFLPKRLLGFLLNLSYEDITIVTCDPWKRNCGGVPRNSFVLVRLSPEKVSSEEQGFCDRVITLLSRCPRCLRIFSKTPRILL
jgi:hypothetical protein